MAMDSRERETWGNEQWVIDRLVDAVSDGAGDDKVKLAEHFLDGLASRDWRRRRIVESGLIVPNRELDGSDADTGQLSEALAAKGVEDQRIEQVLDGADLSPEELGVWREYLVRRLAGSSGDPDGHVEWVLLEVTHSDRKRRAFLAVTDWRNGSGTLAAAYPAYSDVINAMNRAGVVRMDGQRAMEDRWRR